MSMATSERTVKARLNPGRQWIGIDNLTLMEAVQPRAKIDFDWVHDLSGFRKDGSEFPPGRVYQLPDGTLVPAEAHHRIHAMRMAGEDQILCDVVDGTLEDAIVFAAGSNRSNGVKPMGPKDITKAVEMLLAIDEWWCRSDAVIAAHIGCGITKVRAIRNRVAVRDNKAIPDRAIDRNGKERQYSIARGNRPRKINRITPKKQKPYYVARYKNRNISGPTEEAVREKIDKAVAEDDHKLKRGGMMGLIRAKGFTAVFSGLHFKSLTGHYRSGVVVTLCSFSEGDLLPLAIGQLVAARRFKEPGARAIVLCYPDDGPSKVIDLYKQEGFEFLAPEELEAALKS